MLIELGRAELDAARELATLPALPALLTPRAGGGTTPEQARVRLRARGLVDPLGALAPDLHHVIDAFAHAPFEVDVRVAAGRSPEVRAAVTAAGGVAVLAVVTGDHVRFSRLPADAGLAALVDVLPPVEPARGTRISLPVAEVDAAITDAMLAGRDGGAALVGGLAARGLASADARLFVALVGGARLRFAEFGVTVRDSAGRRHRSHRTVAAVDTRRGRAVRYTLGDYLVAEPADRATVVRALAEFRDAELSGTRH